MKYFHLLTLVASCFAQLSLCSDPKVVYSGQKHNGHSVAAIVTNLAHSQSTVPTQSSVFVHTPRFATIAKGVTHQNQAFVHSAQFKSLCEDYKALVPHNSVSPGLSKGQQVVCEAIYDRHCATLTHASYNSLLESNLKLGTTIASLKKEFDFAQKLFAPLESHYSALQAGAAPTFSSKQLLDYVPEHLQEDFVSKAVNNYKLQAQIAGYEECVKLNAKLLEGVQSSIQRIELWNKQLDGIKATVVESGCTADPALLKVLDERSAVLHKVSKIITKEAQDLLAFCQLPEESFKSLVGNPSQQYFFEQAHGIISDSSKLFVHYKNDPHICAYIKATALGCSAIVDSIKNASPQEAVVHYSLAKGLLEVAHGMAKGAAFGAVKNYKAQVDTVMHPVDTITHLKNGLVLFAKLGLRDPDTTIAWYNGWMEFAKLPLAQKSEKFGELLGTFFAPTPHKLCSFVSSTKTYQIFNAIGRVELEKLKALYLVEKTQLVTHKGVTFAKEFAEKLMPYIDAGKITKQEDVVHCLEHWSAPLLKHTEAFVERIQSKALSVPRQAGIACADVKSAVESVPKFGLKPSTKPNMVAAVLEHEKIELKKYLEILARDPAIGNKIKIQNIEEAIAGYVAEKKGLISGPLKRDPTGAAEFIDSKGQLWDVKKAISKAPNGKHIFNPEHLLSKIKEDIADGENIIIDMVKLEQNDIPAFYEKIIQQLTKDEIKRIIVVMKSETEKNLM